MAFLPPFPVIIPSPTLSTTSLRPPPLARRPRVVMAAPAAPLLPTPDDISSNPENPTSSSPSTWLASATREACAGNLLAARHLYECALASAAPDAADAGRIWLAWARSEARLGSTWDGADAVLRRATAAAPGDAYLWHFWAREALARLGRKDARAVLRDALRACPRSAVLRCEAARLEAGAGNYDTARKMLKEAVTVEASDSHAWMEAAMLEVRCGRVEAARRLFGRGVKSVSKGDAAVLYTAFAGVEAKAGRAEQARFLYMRAAEANAGDRYVWQTWAAFEGKAGQTARARELFERGVMAGGGRKDAGIWQAWGVLEWRAGEVATARHLFSRAISVDAADAATWAAWGRLEAGEGNAVEARRLFERATLEMNGKAAAGPLFLSWGMFEAEQGRLDEAIAIFSTGLERGNDGRDDTVRLLHACAMAQRKVGHTDEARPLLMRAMRMNPNDRKTAHSLARLEISAGNYEQARHLLQRAIRDAPADPFIASTLGLLEWQHFAEDGGVERARDVFRDGARFNPRDTTLLRAWSAFETAQGDAELGDRLKARANQRAVRRQGPSPPSRS